MAKPYPIGTLLGLNNRLPVTRLDVSLPNGGNAAWLRVATNIDLTQNGFLRSRPGFGLAAAGAWHSLWADGQQAYGVCNGDLVHIERRTLALSALVPAVGAGRVSFCRLPDGMVYWTNGTRIGRLSGLSPRNAVTPTPNPVPTASATTGGLPPGRYQVCFTALGADGESASTEPAAIALPNGGGIAFSGLTAGTLIYATGPDGEVFNETPSGDYLSPSPDGAPCDTFMLSAMPAGQALAHYKGSLLVARGRWLYVSEPYRYGLHNPRRGFMPFPADISVVQPCEDGVYVCADKTYWLPGDVMATTPVVLLPYGALPGSAAFDETTQTAYWQGPEGAVIARPSGALSVPQDDALIFKPAGTGFTWVRELLGDRHLVTARLGVTTP